MLVPLDIADTLCFIFSPLNYCFYDNINEYYKPQLQDSCELDTDSMWIRKNKESKKTRI